MDALVDVLTQCLSAGARKSALAPFHSQYTNNPSSTAPAGGGMMMMGGGGRSAAAGGGFHSLKMHNCH